MGVDGITETIPMAHTVSRAWVWFGFLGVLLNECSKSFSGKAINILGMALSFPA